ncbi:hypothetical protein IAR55_004287 [Kwoniella newhampshirensis]|uniref:Uncharacterized protein n=1 Tax=Kwoniella newhampshirensis TaxID=1651941 RepID=A0AAW0YJA3_9TREE
MSGSSCTPLISRHLAIVVVISLWLPLARAGYLSVSMTPATQCGNSTVRWSGDDGPYHLLLTPTEFRQHGYNVWIESIPAGTNSYNLDIRQPAGIQYMLTMWGASGITYAATTDVMTVGPSSTNNSSCFLSDQAILDLYSFAFTMNTTTNDDYPPQCSSISFTWPSSLESNVTSGASTNVTKRDCTEGTTPDTTHELDLPMDDIVINQLDASSSDHKGNTTNPPTMFGIIPLGNSFSIPITFDRQSRYARYLPESALSDNPTTFTRQGLTYLNWTVDMAKGTRFILVAGIGSSEEWASGGSTAMLTVGQGSTGCVGSEQSGGGAPSITASGTSTSVESPSGFPAGDGVEISHSNPVVRTAVAVVCSVVGTLVIVGLVIFCRRKRIRRRGSGQGQASSGGPFGVFTDRNGRKVPKTIESSPSGSEAPLDLIASRGEDRRLTPLILGEGNQAASPSASPIDQRDPFRDQNKLHLLSGPSRSTTFDSEAFSSPVSPVRGRDEPTMIRNSSQDALLPRMAGGALLPEVPESSSLNLGHHYDSGTGTWSGGGGSTWQSSARVGGGPLMLHDASARDEDMNQDRGEGTDISDLKRDTIAHFAGGGPSTSLPRSADAPSIASAPPARRRRAQAQARDTEMEYMVHQDAGRVVPPQPGDTANVLELPPRYEELNWTEEETREREQMERQTR